MTNSIDIQDPYWFADVEELDEPEVYLWEDDQGYDLGCSCACECCGCNLICEESQFMLEDEDLDYEEEGH